MPDQTPRAAAGDACVACARDGTATGLTLRGEAEFPLAVLVAKLEVPDTQAVRAIRSYAERELGSEPGKVPTGDHDWTLRLCTACAHGAGLRVGELGSGDVPAYGQPA